MASMKAFTTTLCIFVILSVFNNCASSHAVKGAYWPSWSINFPPSAIETSHFTHIYYAFLSPNNVTFKFEIEKSTASMLVDFTSTLHAKNPPVKTLFSIAGGGGDPLLYSRMVSTFPSRKDFIDSTIAVARKFGFDGIDLDWEFPRNPEDMVNLGLLIDEWRAEVTMEAHSTRRPPLLLTAATYFSADGFLSGVYRSYPIGSISKNLDWVNAMCYDYHGSWNTSETGAHAALFDPKGNLSTSDGLKSWIRAGVPRRKLVMGLPLYGRTWQLKDPKLHGVGAPAIGVGPGGGDLKYSQVEAYNEANNATVVYDKATVSTYSFSGTSWIGYDGVTSTSVKIGYAKALSIRGYFFWAVNGDHDWKISKRASQLWSYRELRGN